MADKITVSLRSGEKVDETHPGPRAPRKGVQRIELGDDRTARLVFYTDPESEIYREPLSQGGKIVVNALIPLFFAPRKVPLRVKYSVRSRTLLSLHLGTRDIKNLWQEWRSERRQESVRVLEPMTADRRRTDKSPAEDAAGETVEFSARSNELPPQPAFDSSYHYPSVSAVLMPFRDDSKGKPVSDVVTAVFESRARLRGQPSIYGSDDPLDEPEVRLVQLPDPTQKESEVVELGVRTWFVGVLGLPYSWGQSIWATLLGEQIRTSQFDPQRSALFAPLLRSAHDHSLQWDASFAIKTEDGHAPEALLHALRMTSADKSRFEEVDFPLLQSHAGTPIRAKLPIAQGFPADKKLESWGDYLQLWSSLMGVFGKPGLALGLRKDRQLVVVADQQKGERPLARSVRIGALDLTFCTSSMQAMGSEPELRWRYVASRFPNLRGYQPEESAIEMEWAVESSLPGGQDDLPGEVYVDCDRALRSSLRPYEQVEWDIECAQLHERPLVIPLRKQENSDDSAPKQTLVLNVRERGRGKDARRIDLELRKLASGASPAPTADDVCSARITDAQDAVVVLDREPFFVAKVSFPTLGSLNTAAQDTTIANWSNHRQDEGAWHIRFPDAQDFCMTLPPQGLGETMEKRKQGDQGLKDGDPADFRFSPPALLSMRERYYQQNFPTAPWNLRRLLSDPRRELPGAHLRHLQYELLYGLSCRVEYPFMRLAEISALVGDVVGPLASDPSWLPRKGGQPAPADLYKAARMRWAEVSKQVRQRLGVFELWDIRALDTLKLKEGVSCWIRGPQGQRPDKLGRVPAAELADPFLSGDTRLKGGVTWGFESRNVYDAVMGEGLRWPGASGAEIGETRLSALGGYGHQMAAFDNWRTKILADVAMGRTYSYTLERVGRIGVWWNRAKHVIIYQRTVVPSRQFGSLPPNDVDEQNLLEGRAVVRKVEEYVEILQNKRGYPDSQGGEPMATGFVTACSFSEDPHQVIRFHVRSSWGTDVGKVGWKVPIWRPGEVPEDLYPKPVVSLTVMASVDGESVTRQLTIKDPENLFFYTDTTKTPEAKENEKIDLSNSDLWAPVEGVDFVDELRPQPSANAAFSEGKLDQASPGDALLPAGFRPCTFLIEPAEHKVDLLAHRQGEPMGAAISSITLCRAKLKREATSVLQKVRSAGEVVAGEIEQRMRQLPVEPGRLRLDDLETSFQDLCASTGGKVNELLAGPREKLDGVAKEFESFLAVIERLDKQAAENINLGAQRLVAFPNEVVARHKQNKEALKAALKLELDRAEAQVALLPSPTAYLASVRNALLEAQGQLDASFARLESILVPGPNTPDWAAYWLAGDDLPRLVTLRERLGLYRSQLKSIAQRLRGMAQTEAALESGGKNLALGAGPRWVQERLQPGKIAAAVDQVEALLAAAQRLTEIPRQQQDKYLALVRKRLVQLGEQKTLLSELLGDAGDLIEDLRKKVEDAETAKKKQITDFAAAVGKAVNDEIDRPLPVDAEGLAAKWAAVVKAQADALQGEVEKTAKAIRDQSQEFITEIKDLVPNSTAVSNVVTERCQALTKGLRDLIAELGKDLRVEEQLAEVRQFLERQRDAAVQEVEERLGGGIKAVRQALGEIESTGHNVLNLARAFGKPPDVSGLKFDRPEVAFFYDELQKRVDVTPVIARAAQVSAVADALKPFGVDLPVKQLAEKLIPEDLKKFDLSSILPNISGIPLKNLFSGLKMPDTGENVKVRHGVDRQTRRAWVNVNVGFQAKQSATLFAVGPLAVLINQPQFLAEARIEVGLDGSQEKRVKGLLSGDWQLQIGGFQLITFEQTPLEFDEAGRIRFEVDPRRVKLAPAMEFINDLLTSMSPGGLTTRFDGTGVVSSLDMPIPDTQVGAFGFSGLRLGAALALRFGGPEGFSIGVSAFLGRLDAPFNLTIFILGGGGYLELGSRYFPSTGRVESTADLAITASASLAIALGPIRGGVAVYVGVTASYNSGRGGGLYVGLLFMIRGHVSVLSIASATITLRLQGTYQGGALVGSGYLEIKIKICWCFTLEVSESVEYTLGRVGSSKRSALGGPQAVAQLASLGGPSAGVPPPQEPPGFKPKLLQERLNAYFLMLV